MLFKEKFLIFLDGGPDGTGADFVGPPLPEAQKIAAEKERIARANRERRETIAASKFTEQMAKLDLAKLREKIGEGDNDERLLNFLNGLEFQGLVLGPLTAGSGLRDELPKIKQALTKHFESKKLHENSAVLKIVREAMESPNLTGEAMVDRFAQFFAAAAMVRLQEDPNLEKFFAANPQATYSISFTEEGDPKLTLGKQELYQEFFKTEKAKAEQAKEEAAIAKIAEEMAADPLIDTVVFLYKKDGENKEQTIMRLAKGEGVDLMGRFLLAALGLPGPYKKFRESMEGLMVQYFPAGLGMMKMVEKSARGFAKKMEKSGKKPQEGEEIQWVDAKTVEFPEEFLAGQSSFELKDNMEFGSESFAGKHLEVDLTSLKEEGQKINMLNGQVMDVSEKEFDPALMEEKQKFMAIGQGKFVVKDFEALRVVAGAKLRLVSDQKEAV